MTTIITNGSYILADHRLTSSDNRVNRFDYLKNVNKIYTRLDVGRKLQLIVNSGVVNSKGAKLIAGATSGSAVFGDELHHKLKIIGNKKLTLREFSSLVYSKIIGDCGFVGVFSDKTSCVIRFNEKMTTHKEYKNGEVVGIGSGFSIIDKAKNFGSKKLHLHDMMMLAAGSDESTSHSYSVFGVEENILYVNVCPSPKDIEMQTKNILKNKLTFNPSLYRNYQ